jgi:hypothetical protein
MGVAITSRPIVTINDSPVVKSRWVAVWNPIVYDFEFTDIEDTIAYLIVYIHEYGSNTLLGKSTYTPRASTLKVDISHELRSYLYSQYNPDFSGSFNYKDVGSTLKCYVKYQLVTIESGNTLISGSIISDETNYIYATNSAKQIKEVYGQNMGEYVPFGIDGIIKAKFLTKFEEPVYFSGYPFTLSFIFSDLIVGHEIKLIEDRLNINGSSITNEETNLSKAYNHSINYLKLQDSYSVNVKYVDVSLSTGEASPELYVQSGYVESGYIEVR